MREPPCLSKRPTEKIQISSRLTSITNLLVKNMDLKQRSLKHFITQKDQIIFPLRRATWPTLFSSQEKGNHLKTICWVGAAKQTDRLKDTGEDTVFIYITCTKNRSKGFISYQPYRWGSFFLFDHFHQPPCFQFLNPHPPGTCFKYKRQVSLYLL